MIWTAGTLFVMAISTVWCFLEARRLRRELAATQAVLASERTQAADRAASYAAEISRREAIIAELHREIAELDRDLDSCDAPGAIRTRLDRLFALAQDTDSGKYDVPQGSATPRAVSADIGPQRRVP